jgi:general secretion pathway protein K
MKVVTLKANSGVALILVLMVTAILGILMLQIGLTARDQLRQTEILQFRAEASLALHSRESALLFSLLTNRWLPIEGAITTNPYASAWNFGGEPFEVDGVTFRIQDEKSMFRIPPPGSDHVAFRALLSQIGIEDGRADAIIESVKKMQEVDPGGFDRPAEYSPLQDLGELLVNTEINQAELQRLQRVATLVPAQYFNPFSAPDEVLRARYAGVIGETVVELKRNGQLSMASLFDTTGEGFDDQIVAYPGPALRIGARYAADGIAFTRSGVLFVNPYADAAITVWSKRSSLEQDSSP